MKITKQTYLYPITIEACEEGGYFASCPMLQGCHADGETYGEAIDNIHDVIQEHIKLREEHGELISFNKLKKHTEMNIKIPVPAFS